jgi:hypothetical protein
LPQPPIFPPYFAPMGLPRVSGRISDCDVPGPAWDMPGAIHDLWRWWNEPEKKRREQKACEDAFPGLPVCSDTEVLYTSATSACQYCNNDRQEWWLFRPENRTPMDEETPGLANPVHYSCIGKGKRRWRNVGTSIICGKCCEVDSSGKAKSVERCKCAPH